MPAEAWTALEHELRYREPGVYFTWRGKHGYNAEGKVVPSGRDVAPMDDGIRPLLVKVPDGRWAFPAGLLTRALGAVGPYHVKVGLDSAIPRLEPSVPYEAPLPDGTVLFPEQQMAARAAVHYQRGLWALAVNAGKTVLAAWLAHAYANCQVLYLINARSLMAQAVEDLERHLQRPVGRCGSGARIGLNRRLVVAMVQTLHARHKDPEVQALINRTQVLIVDEADAISPNTWFPILGSCPAPIRIGMSGTLKDHRTPIVAECFFGPVIAEVLDKELVALGRSAVPTILMPMSGAAVRETSDYKEIYGPGIVRNAGRNRLLADAVAWGAARGLRSLILYFQIEHGDLIATELLRRDVRYAVLHGGTPPHDILRAQQALRAHQLDCVVASRIGDRGWNIPELDLVLNAAGWKSKRAAWQKFGRGLRKKPTGPNRVILLDPYDLGSRLLRRHSEARYRLYIRRGFAVQRGQLPELLAALTV